jgi:hypothetical protein
VEYLKLNWGESPESALATQTMVFLFDPGDKREAQLLVRFPSVADSLYMGLPAVKTHVGCIVAKLGARDRAQLVVIAYESGLITLG